MSDYDDDILLWSEREAERRMASASMRGVDVCGGG
jgi:hypothetical protein